MNLRQNHLHSLCRNHLYSLWQNIHQNPQHLHHQKKHGSGSKRHSAGLIKQKAITKVQIILLLAIKTKRAMEESMRKKRRF